MLELNQNSGIYSITNLINNKRYIGSSVNLSSRKAQHWYCLNSNIGINSHLQNAWNKYGSENFVFEILENCPQNLLILREKFYIEKYDTLDTNFGYNFKEPTPSSLINYPEHNELIQFYKAKESKKLIKFLEKERPFYVFKKEEQLNKLCYEYYFLSTIKDKNVKEFLWNHSGYLKYKSGFENISQMNSYKQILEEHEINNLLNFNIKNIYNFNLFDSEKIHHNLIKNLKDFNIIGFKVNSYIFNNLKSINIRNRTSYEKICLFLYVFKHFIEKDFEYIIKSNFHELVKCFNQNISKNVLQEALERKQYENCFVGEGRSVEIVDWDFQSFYNKLKNGSFICQVCGKEFGYYTNSKNKKRRKYCKECGDIIKHNKSTMIIKICVDCKEKFECNSKYYRTIRCKECQEKRNRNLDLIRKKYKQT